jgi:hypothetical protein
MNSDTHGFGDVEQMETEGAENMETGGTPVLRMSGGQQVVFLAAESA